jgi:hypothetical protein
MLEEAYIWHAVLSMSITHKGASKSKDGEARVTLAHQAAAKWCVSHFHGRSWGANGKGVSAEMIPPIGLAKGIRRRIDASSSSSSAKLTLEEMTPISHLSANAPEFVPFGGLFSAEAPAFVPAPLAEESTQREDGNQTAS